MKLGQLLFLVVYLISKSHGLLGKPKITRYEIVGDPGEPLLLSPYLEANRTDEARNLSQVTYDGFFGVKSYSGFFTVDKVYSSNLFFWFFPSENNYSSDPIVVWLNGGPGSSSIQYGLLVEHGPFQIVNATTIKLREYRWNRNASIVYIDSPVGTGYSFTNEGYADNETKVGEDLYTAIAQFFQLFPELQQNDFYITGESYAGKYVPAFAYTVHNKNPEAEAKMNLKGIVIGDGVTDPYHQHIYADYLAGLGLLDSTQQAEVKKLEVIMKNAIASEDYRTGTAAWQTLTEAVVNITGVSRFNYAYNDTQEFEDAADQFIQSADIRAAIHVGSTDFGTDDVYLHLYEDVAKNVTSWVEALLDHYRVLLYTGQWDVTLNYPTTQVYIATLNSTSVELFKNATRYKYFVQNGTKQDLAGYVKQGGNLTDVLIRNAGHLSPFQQPVWLLDLFNTFVHDSPFVRSPEN